ncbi:MAG: hypothetical protein IAE78_08330 [Myxococcus sp.]|nr:hypothetical protein [Myxococcus sp.]
MSRWLALVLLLLGCPDRRQAAAPVEGPAVTQADPSDAGGLVTSARLDAWLGYHRALRAGPDAGPEDAREKATRERAVRLAAGLSERDVDELEELIGAVVTQRTIGRLTGADAMRGFEKVAAGLPLEQRQRVEAAFGDVKARAQQGSALEAERARFGDEAVALVLAREAELTEVWDWLLNGRGER